MYLKKICWLDMSFKTSAVIQVKNWCQGLLFYVILFLFYCCHWHTHVAFF